MACCKSRASTATLAGLSKSNDAIVCFCALYIYIYIKQLLMLAIKVYALFWTASYTARPLPGKQRSNKKNSHKWKSLGLVNFHRGREVEAGGSDQVRNIRTRLVTCTRSQASVQALFIRISVSCLCHVKGMTPGRFVLYSFSVWTHFLQTPGLLPKVPPRGPHSAAPPVGWKQSVL